MNYNYTLRGVSSELTFTVYGGMYDYLVSSEDSSVSYYAGQQPSPEEINRIVTLRYSMKPLRKANCIILLVQLNKSRRMKMTKLG